MSEEKKRVLLPTDVKPTLYRLHLSPDLTAFTFKGTVRIELHVNKATRSVSFHGLDLEIASVKLDLSGQISAASKLSYNKEDEVHTAEFDSELSVGSSPVLHIVFSGVLNDKMVGFYRSKYSHAGKEQYVLF